MRYHKKVFFPSEHLTEINRLTERLNSLNFKPSSHCLDNLKHRIIDIKALLLFIKALRLNPSEVFEYYTEEKEIFKLCYRINWNESDLILVLSKDKEIITIYLNSKEDNHETLKKELYQTN